MASASYWQPDWFLTGWFPSVWFAPADESGVPEGELRPEFGGGGDIPYRRPRLHPVRKVRDVAMSPAAAGLSAARAYGAREVLAPAGAAGVSRAVCGAVAERQALASAHGRAAVTASARIAWHGVSLVEAAAIVAWLRARG